IKRGPQSAFSSLDRSEKFDAEKRGQRMGNFQNQRPLRYDLLGGFVDQSLVVLGRGGSLTALFVNSTLPFALSLDVTFFFLLASAAGGTVGLVRFRREWRSNRAARRGELSRTK
ncbi:MAG: hypothetical protein IH897_13380, partial [Planctomycetes bacterium]|nr:hypothetical protein [Planctomycetota bacterium]